MRLLRAGLDGTGRAVVFESDFDPSSVRVNDTTAFVGVRSPLPAIYRVNKCGCP
jgi:hypothetical protein